MDDVNDCTEIRSEEHPGRSENVCCRQLNPFSASDLDKLTSDIQDVQDRVIADVDAWYPLVQVK